MTLQGLYEGDEDVFRHFKKRPIVPACPHRINVEWREAAHFMLASKWNI
jgi:hypothetical protein